MAKYIFSDREGIIGGTSLPPNPLTGIEQLVPPPPGPHLDLLTRQGYPFGSFSDAAFRTTRLSRTFFALEEGGILAKSDFVSIRTGTLGILANMIEGGDDATLGAGGAAPTLTAAGDLLTDGVDDYVDLKLNLNVSKWTLNDAGLAVWVENENATGNTPVIGRITGVDVVRLYLGVSTNTAVGVRVNSETTWLPAYSGADAGLWAIQRRAGGNLDLYKDGVLVATTTGNAATAIPADLAFGRNSGVFAAYQASYFRYGGSLEASEIAAEYAAVAAHRAVVK